MRKTNIIWIVFLALCCSLFGQNKQLRYDFTEIPQSSLDNPATDLDYKWYGGAPLLSGISLQAGSSGISINDIFAADGLDINDKVRERAVYGMRIKDEFTLSYQVELLSGGFRGKDPNVFFSFGIYTEADAIVYWPKDYAILAFEGNADNLGQRFNLGHLKMKGELVTVFHIGANKKINERLRLGARAKLYSGALDVVSSHNSGYFVSNEGQNNAIANTIDTKMKLRSSGFIALDKALDEESLPGTMLRRSLLGGDLGLGLDLGLTYNLSEQLVVTGSVLDLGFIYHTTDVKSFTLEGRATVEGVEIILPDVLANINTDFWQDLVDEVEALVPFDHNFKNYITFRPTKLNASIRYNFGEQLESREICDCSTDGAIDSRSPKYANAVGGQLYMINRPRGPQTALTAFFFKRLGNSIAVKTTWTADKYSVTNIGLGISLQLGPVNMYGLVDNLLAYRNLAASNYASFQLGLNIISWDRK